MKLPRFVFPEGENKKILKAVRHFITKRLIHPILIGNASVISSILGLTEGFTVIETDLSFTNSVEQGAALVKSGEADGIIAGIDHETGDVLKAYFQHLRKSGDKSLVSSLFSMTKKGQHYLFTDCAVNVCPNGEELAEIARQAVEFAPLTGIKKPKVAFLSFSSGPKDHEMVKKVAEAVEILRLRFPDMEKTGLIEGPVQADAALVEFILRKKLPLTEFVGKANILIFPNLDAGNIAYKLVELLAKFRAIGPLVTGLGTFIAHDLSRGCKASAVVEVINISIRQFNEQ